MCTAPHPGLGRFGSTTIVLVVFVFCAVAAIASPAQTLTTLTSFDGTDGASPFAGLVQGSDGSFYGTTYEGGANGGSSGTIFKVTPSGTLTPLYSFCSQPGCSDGASPFAGLVQGVDGNFYGTTSYGGSSSNCANGCGTIFRITPQGSLLILHSFSGVDGANPIGTLILGHDGAFYGTTYAGGTGSNCSTFQPSGCGTIFKITPTGTLTTLHTFDLVDGDNPAAGLVQATNGNFYGTTSAGVASGPICSLGCGTIFEITPAGTMTTLHVFQGPDGSFPLAPLIQGRDSNLYGTTPNGGTVNCGATYGCGTIFKITPQGTLTTLYSFCSQPNCTDGAFPYGGLIQATDGGLYGTTSIGGTNDAGIIFRTAAGTITPLYSFCTQANCADGASPQDALLQTSDGNFYGTTTGGGTNGKGTVFKLMSQESRFLSFPLMNKTATTALINSVFDHSMNIAPGNSMQYGYCADDIVTAFTGETGTVPPTSLVGSNFICGVLSLTPISLYGWSQSNGQNFSINGQYWGAGTPQYLFYDGHPGFDYVTTDQTITGRLCGHPGCNQSGNTPVLAAAAGTVVCVNISPLKQAPCTEGPGEIKIDHENGYMTIYLHLAAAAPGLTAGQHVTSQQVIGISGHTGADEGGPHLHFEVREQVTGTNCPSNLCPVDPYGWSGLGPDPYTRATNLYLWQ